MKRSHIHFAVGVPGDSQVISGMYVGASTVCPCVCHVQPHACGCGTSILQDLMYYQFNVLPV